MGEHPLEILSRRYPQLLLPIRSGMKDTEEYKDVVLRGKRAERRPDFSLNGKDSLALFCTPAGNVDILTLADRLDFEHAVQALAQRCEPDPVPPSMGASTVIGLINWEKIHSHMDAYEAGGGEDSDSEFEKFVSDKSNYLDALIILSSGEYSAVPSEKMNLPYDVWIEKSIEIRKYHELSHFYSRKLYPENREAVRDEIVADMDGIISAFGYYDTAAARLFLGIEGHSYREGGRLQNYVSGRDGESVMNRANELIDILADAVKSRYGDGVFSLLDFVEKNKIGL